MDGGVWCRLVFGIGNIFLSDFYLVGYSTWPTVECMFVIGMPVMYVSMYGCPLSSPTCKPTY